MTVSSWRQQYASPDGIQSPRPAVRVLQGLAAEIPVLAEGEFYYATDTGEASIGPTPIALAPLASPAFTGSPTAPTQTVGDNTTKVATTAFVIANAGSGGVSYTTVGKTTTYTAIVGDDVWCTGTFTVTIPVLSTTQRVKVSNRGTGAITVAPTSGTIIGAASLVLGTQYSSIEIAGDGTNLTVE